MNKLLLGFSIACLASAPVVLAQDRPSRPPAQPPQTSAPARQPAAKTRTVNAEFVSYDDTTKRITVRDEKGQTRTTTVEGEALKQVTTLKKGDNVTLTYREDAKGVLQAVTSIKPAPAPRTQPR